MQAQDYLHLSLNAPLAQNSKNSATPVCVSAPIFLCPGFREWAGVLPLCRDSLLNSIRKPRSTYFKSLLKIHQSYWRVTEDPRLVRSLLWTVSVSKSSLYLTHQEGSPLICQQEESATKSLSETLNLSSSAKYLRVNLRRTASSRSKGLFVAARTNTRSLSLVRSPSQCTINSFFILRMASCALLDFPSFQAYCQPVNEIQKCEYNT